VLTAITQVAPRRNGRRDDRCPSEGTTAGYGRSMGWWNRRSETTRDAVGAIPLVLIFVVAQQGFAGDRSITRGILVVLAIGLAMTVRRRWPVVSYVTALATVALAQTGLELLCVIGYSLIVYEPRARPALVAPASALAAFLGYLQYWPAFVLADVAPDLAIIAVVAISPVLLGIGVRRYRTTVDELAARNAELVRLREQAASHAVQTERLRIARELHDVVAHHVSAMTVRARAGHHVAANDPAAAREALAYVASAGTATLNSMRTFVGTLRDGATEGSSDPAGAVPQPGVEDVPALLETFRGTGLVVHADLADPTVEIGPALGLNIYRIVQEALTNVIRHGAAERAWVHIHYDEDAVHIQIDDNGRGLQSDGRTPGHGLVGVAERAALHGGTSGLGPSPRGGCRLHATLRVASSAGGQRRVADAPVVPS
jgi:signal transduction histidine kinase